MATITQLEFLQTAFISEMIPLPAMAAAMYSLQSMIHRAMPSGEEVPEDLPMIGDIPLRSTAAEIFLFAELSWTPVTSIRSC